MLNLSFVFGLFAVLTSAFFGGLFARSLNQPIMFGYLLAGLLVSGIIERLGVNREVLVLLAEFGMAFLLFTLGLEFSIEKVKKAALLGSVAQIVLTIFCGIFLFQKIFGFNFQTAFILACAFSLSSTAIVVKHLQEKGQLESLPGEIMIGWLLTQDLAVLPLISLIPILFGGENFVFNVVLMARAILVLIIVFLSAQKIAPVLTDFIASFKNRELLLIFVVCLVFFFAFFTASFGFSFALGAFLAGLVLNQTRSNHAIFSEIRPLRDVLLAVFFVSLGLSLSPKFILTNIAVIVLLAFLILSIKIILTGLILIYFRYHAKTIFPISFGLAQVGEFSFALAMFAFSGKFLDNFSYSMVISVTLLTMVVTPFLFSLADKAYQKSARFFYKWPAIYSRFFVQFDQYRSVEELPIEKHVVVLGYGRVGKWIGRILEKSGIPYLVVEYDPQIVRSLKLAEKRVIFGDPTDLDVLDFAQVDKAKMVILTIPDTLVQEIVITNCYTLNPNVKIICRSHIEEDYQTLASMGVNYIIQPEFEAALSMGHRILQDFGWKKDEINNKIKEMKKEHKKLHEHI